MEEDVPYFSPGWFLTGVAAALPVASGKAVRAIGKVAGKAVDGAVDGAKKLASEAADNSRDWLEPMKRGIRNEAKVLDGLGYTKNTKKYTVEVNKQPVTIIPDIVDHTEKILGEVKDVTQLGWDRQLRAEFALAKKMDYRYVLFIRTDTALTGDLALQVRRGTIGRVPIDDFIE